MFLQGEPPQRKPWLAFLVGFWLAWLGVWLAFWLVWFGSWLAFWLVWFGSWLAFWLVWFGSWLAFWLVWFGFLFFACFFFSSPCRNAAAWHFASISRGYYFAATRLPVDTPPLVAVKVQSRLSQSSGPVEAAPVMVSVAPVRTGGCEARRGCCARGHVAHRGEVPGVGCVVDGQRAAVIPVAELSRPTLAAPVMLSELPDTAPDTAPVDDSVAPATVPVAVSAAQEMAPEASTPVVNTSVQFTSLHSSWSQPTLPCAVSPSSVAA